MAYITAVEVAKLTTCDRLKSTDTMLADMYIAASTSILGGYRFDSTREGFDSAAKLASLLIIDFIAMSNLAGGAFETERVGDKISYNMRDSGMKKKLEEVERIMGSYIITGSTKKVRKTRLVRRY